MVKRVEYIEQIQEKILGSHEAKFGWVGSRDGRTGYYYKFVPPKYDYSAWKRKFEVLGNVLDFLKEVDQALDELERAGAGDAIIIAATRYDVTCKIQEGVLKVGYGYTYMDKMIRDLRPSVEAEGELTMEEYLNKAKEKIKGCDSREALEFFTEAFQEEYMRTKAHLDFLEEELDFLEEEVDE